jgi:hypothetical protein
MTVFLTFNAGDALKSRRMYVISRRRLIAIARVLFACITTAFLVAVVTIATSDPDPITGNGHGGRWGTAVITYCRGASLSQCYGDFVSDSGAIRREGVQIWYSGTATVGQHVRAYADANDQDVTRPGSSAIATNVIGMAVCGFWWLISIAWLASPLWSRRSRERRREAAGVAFPARRT